MKALRGADAASQEEEEGDGSWLLSLLKVRTVLYGIECMYMMCIRCVTMRVLHCTVNQSVTGCVSVCVRVIIE